MTRTRLPHRRPALTIDTAWQGHPLTVTVGMMPNGTPGEVFAQTAHGGQMQDAIADACVLISIALQHGVQPADLAKSLGRVPHWANGIETDAPASPVGTILEVIEGEM